MDTAVGCRIASLLEGGTCNLNDTLCISAGTLSSVVQAFAHYAPGGEVDAKKLFQRPFIARHKLGKQQFDIDVVFAVLVHLGIGLSDQCWRGIKDRIAAGLWGWGRVG
jgi:hypothetical protein